MFETLQNAFEKAKPLDRRWAILMYSTNVVLSSFALILERGHGFVQGHARPLLFGLVVWAVMLLLSLMWLAASLKSSVPITRRDCAVRLAILQGLFLLAAGLADILR